MHIDFNLTHMSAIELENITNINMTANEVFSHLNDKIKVRKLTDTLKDFSGGVDIDAQLKSKLLEYSPGVKPESIDRKVRDWLVGKHEPAEREDYIKICFALNLMEARAREFMSMTTDGTFHLRSPKELVFVFALRTGMDYSAAIKFYQTLKPLRQSQSKEVFALTQPISDAFASVHDEKSFRDFYAEHYDSLGELHNTAYIHFLNFLETLSRPGVPLYTKKDEDYTLEDIAEVYFSRMNVPLDKRTKKYTVLQQTIKKFWTNTTGLKRMKNRSEDITRRGLLLLYLFTEGAVIGGADEYILDEDITDLERFTEHYWRLTSMLNQCGMSPLDPRGVFDWLVLYSLKASDDFGMSERLEEILSVIFSD